MNLLTLGSNVKTLDWGEGDLSLVLHFGCSNFLNLTTMFSSTSINPQSSKINTTPVLMTT